MNNDRPKKKSELAAKIEKQVDRLTDRVRQVQANKEKKKQQKERLKAKSYEHRIAALVEATIKDLPAIIEYEVSSSGSDKIRVDLTGDDIEDFLPGFSDVLAARLQTEGFVEGVHFRRRTDPDDILTLTLGENLEPDPLTWVDDDEEDWEDDE